MAPKVSVCIPAYNNAKYIGDAISSILGQTFRDFELIIVDDCSTDNTLEVAHGFARLDDRIVIRENRSNIGMVENWNLCLEMARGKYVKYVFGDDLLNEPEALQRLVDVLDANPSVSLVSSSRFEIDEDSRVIRELGHFPDSSCFTGDAVISRCLAEFKNYIGEPSIVMFRKGQAARGFDTRYRQLVDLEMWFHLLGQGSFYFIGVPISSFRVHSEQQTKVNRRNVAHIDDILFMNSEYLDKGYLKLGRLRKWFIIYNQYYRAWKLTRTEAENYEKAVEKISNHYGYLRFCLEMPLYKIVNPYFKLKKILTERFISQSQKNVKCK